MFLATGMSNMEKAALLKSGHRNVLISYYYIKKKSPEKIAEDMKWLKDNNFCFWLDSGAFTFNNLLGKSITKELTQEFFDGYKDFIIKYYDQIFYYAELDVDPVFGYDYVKFLNSQIPSQYQDKLISVHHPFSRSDKCFKEVCKTIKSKYIAFASDYGNEKDNNYYGSFVMHARKEGVRMHAFALVDNSILTKVPFFSVDSSTWTMGVRYGEPIYFNPTDGTLRRLKMRDAKSVKKHLSMIAQRHPEFMKIWQKEGDGKRPSSEFILTISAIAYHEFEEYATKLWELRGIKY